MAGELVISAGPYDIYSSKESGYDPKNQVVRRLGAVVGVPIAKTAGDVYNIVTKLPTNYAPATGFRVELLVVDDGRDSADLGKVAVFGAVVKRMIAGENIDTTTNLGTEVTANVTLNAATGNVALCTINIVTASLDSAVAGDHIILQFRRVGGASDTCVGPVVLLRVSASAY